MLKGSPLHEFAEPLEKPSHYSGNIEAIWDAGSEEAVSKLGIRAEGPPVSRPGRQAGNGFVGKISAEGAALPRVSRLQRSSDLVRLSRPDGRAYSLAALRACSLLHPRALSLPPRRRGSLNH
jgi:hypothetical protein